MVQFKDLGKKAKDLFKKKYDYKNEVKVVSNANGVKVETGGYQSSGLAGYTKANFSDKMLGDVELEAHSTGVTKAQLKYKNVADGVDVTLNGSACGNLSVETTYAQDSIWGTASVSHSLSKGATKIALSAVIASDGVSVGGSVNLDAANPTSPSDYNMGAEYSQSDLTASLVTSNQGNDITASYFQKVSGDLSLGASMLVQPDAGSRLFTFGGDYSLDASTGVKAKCDSNGIVGTAITHNLAKPNCAFTISAQFDALSSDVLAAQKLGVSVEF